MSVNSFFTQWFRVPYIPHLANAANFLSSTKTCGMTTVLELIIIGLGVPWIVRLKENGEIVVSTTLTRSH